MRETVHTGEFMLSVCGGFTGKKQKSCEDAARCTVQCVHVRVSPPHCTPPQPSPTQLPLPLDVGIPELLNAPSLAEICLKSSECEAGNEAMLSPSLCLPNV